MASRIKWPRLALVVTALAAACSSPAGPSASPAIATPIPSVAIATPASSVATPEPTAPEVTAQASPTITFGPPPDPPIATRPPPPQDGDHETIRPGMVVRVTVDNLRVREWPTTSSAIAGTLHRGDLVELRYGMLDAGGYRWMAARHVGGAQLPALPDGPPDASDSVGGWIAVAKGDVEYVAPEPARCPERVDLTQLSGMLPAEQLACFGRATLAVQGTYGCPGCGGASPYDATPAWLAGPWDQEFLSVDITKRFGPFFLNFPPPHPDIAFLQDETGIHGAPILRVVGHFSDPRSSSCQILGPTDFRVSDAPLVAYDPVVARLICRQRFVVDSFEIVGWDPNFTGG